MNPYEEKLKEYLQKNNILAEHMSFVQSCHSVKEAALVANVDASEFVKNICMIDAEGNLITAIVKGEDRASTSRVGKALNIEQPRTATPDEILEKAGYPCGGTPSFGYKAIYLIDPRVMELDFVYTGGGSPNSLTKIKTVDLQTANEGRVARVRD